MMQSIVFGIFLYFTIIIGYFMILPFLDFESIKTSLFNGQGIDQSNFIFVALYISFCNSFLEEYFFRGLLLQSNIFISALLFSLYHLCMMIGWFNPILLLLAICGLFVVGYVLNLIASKVNGIFSTWIIHMFCNFGINTIGFIILGMI